MWAAFSPPARAGIARVPITAGRLEQCEKVPCSRKKQ